MKKLTVVLCAILLASLVALTACGPYEELPDTEPDTTVTTEGNGTNSTAGDTEGNIESDTEGDTEGGIKIH